MQINEFFKIDEFKCKCGCGKGDPCKKLIEILTEIRLHFGKPLIITSGTRCPEHNKKVGGSPRSQHLQDKAADFVIEGVETDKVWDYVEKNYKKKGKGLGVARKRNANNPFGGFIHIDTRGYDAVWEY